jgi:crotonobetainyl-CoA:carnitine CoA-transferase CaiB-like acyl-CoA transferase
VVSGKKPLGHINVIDMGVGLGALLMTKMLRDCGARITRVEPPSGDPFYGIYPAYGVLRTEEPVKGLSDESLNALLAEADICIVGGEGVPKSSGAFSPQSIAERFPHIVVSNIEPCAAPHPGDPDYSSELVAQALVGSVFDRFSKRPIAIMPAEANFGAALLGLNATLAALYERHNSGNGQIASTSLQEGTMAWRAMRWFHASAPVGPAPITVPRDARQLIFRCEDGGYIHLTLGRRGSALKLNQILGIDNPDINEATRGVADSVDPKNFFGDWDALAGPISRWKRDDLIKILVQEEITVEPALMPGECWSDPQIAFNDILARDGAGTRHVGSPIKIETVPNTAKDGRSGGSRSLDELKVVDFGSYVAGPLASRLLSDMGASVIKVEPLEGDAARVLLPSFAAANRGKRSIAINLKSEAGQEIAKRLCADADIIQHNFRPGVAERLGLSEQQQRQSNPGVVLLQTTAYGPSGPKSQRPGFDMIFQALCGHEIRLGGKGNAPEWNSSAVVDTTAGMLGGISLLVALIARQRDDAGSNLDVNLLNAGLFLMSELVQKNDGTFLGAPILNASQTGFSAAERMYQAADGWVALVVRSDADANSLVKLLDLGGSVTSQVTQWDDGDAHAIARAICIRNTQDLVAQLRDVGISVAACVENGRDTCFANEEMRRLGVVLEGAQPNLGETLQVGAGFRLSRRAKASRSKAHVPALGEHTRELLLELGYRESEISTFFTQGIVA